jgi:hypothetical protein
VIWAKGEARTGTLPGRAAARGVLEPQPAVVESVATFLRRVARIEFEVCPHCGCTMHVVAVIVPVRQCGPP